MPDYHPSLPVGMEQKTQFKDYTVEVRNRFKRLDLIYRVPDELWMEAHDIVQVAVIKTSPVERNAKMQNGSLRRPYEKLREEKRKAKEKRKDIPI